VIHFVEVKTAEMVGPELDLRLSEASAKNEGKLSCEEECSLPVAITLSKSLCMRGGYGSNRNGFTTLNSSRISPPLKRHLLTWTFLMRETRSLSGLLVEAKLGDVVQVPAELVVPS
jgi:hypothetical protein